MMCANSDISPFIAHLLPPPSPLQTLLRDAVDVVNNEAIATASFEHVVIASAAVVAEESWRSAINDAERSVAADLLRLELANFKAREIEMGTAPAPVFEGPAVGGGGGPAIWADDVEATMARVVSGYLTPLPPALYTVTHRWGNYIDLPYGTSFVERRVFRRLAEAEEVLVDDVIEECQYTSDFLGWLQGDYGGLKRRCMCDDCAVRFGGRYSASERASHIVRRTDPSLPLTLPTGLDDRAPQRASRAADR